MRSTRYVMGTGLAVGALAVTATALVYPVVSGLRARTSANRSPGTVPTQYGPLTALDHEFLVKVRPAGLWGLPARQMALQKGTSAAARTAGERLIDGHTGLGASVRRIASQLGVTLPDRPTVQQQGFPSTLSSAQGTESDERFADIPRLQHGKVLTVIAQIRAAVRNSLGRQPADQADTTVLDHMTVLERMAVVRSDHNAIDTSEPRCEPGRHGGAPATAGRTDARRHPVLHVLTPPSGVVPRAVSNEMSIPCRIENQ
jgi:predicted outer membrane protein